MFIQLNLRDSTLNNFDKELIDMFLHYSHQKTDNFYKIKQMNTTIFQIQIGGKINQIY